MPTDPYAKYNSNNNSDDPYAKYNGIPQDSSLADLPGIPIQGQKSVSDFISDKLPNSAQNFVSDTATGLGNLVTNLPATAKSIVDVGTGAVARLAGTESKFPKESQAADVVGAGLKNRYGSLDNIGNTLYNDPVGSAADASLVLDPLAAGADLVKAGGVAKGLRTASDFTNPIHYATYPVGKAIDKVADVTSGSLMKSALRDSGTPLKDVPRGSEMARNLGVSFNNKGLDKTKQAIQPVESEITKRVNAATNAGYRIDPMDVTQPLRDEMSELGRANTNSPIVDQMSKVQNRYLDPREVFNPSTNTVPNSRGSHFYMDTPEEAMLSKRASYKGNQAAYQNHMTENAPTTRANQLVAQGEMTAIEDAVTKALGVQHPSLHDLSSREGDMIVVKNAIKEELEKQSAGLGGPSISSGINLNGDPRVMARSLMGSPAFRSKIAVLLDKSRKGAKLMNKVGANADTANLSSLIGRYTIVPE